MASEKPATRRARGEPRHPRPESGPLHVRPAVRQLEAVADAAQGGYRVGPETLVDLAPDRGEVDVDDIAAQVGNSPSQISSRMVCRVTTRPAWPTSR